MNGAVIENLSNRKLFYIMGSLVVSQVIFFLIGGVFAPVPTSSMEFEMSKCSDPLKDPSNTKKWFYLRPHQKCDFIEDLASYSPSSFDLREIVFIAQMPHIRGNIQLEYSPWFQFLLGVLQVEIEYDENFKYVPGAKLLLEVRLGVKDSIDGEWLEHSSANITRTLDCVMDEEKKRAGALYNCDVIDLFELGSNPYRFYLLNIRIPISQANCRFDATSPNCQIGKLSNLRVIAIHQNGGFTFVWLWMKTAISPIMIWTVYWYWKRIHLLSRNPLLLEKAILALGCSMAILDIPFEWMSLSSRIPFLLFLSDIRQGIFYWFLFSFWLIFAGEHMIDDTSRNNIASYRSNLVFISASSAALLVYDLFERGLQLRDPFHSIWATDFGTSIAWWSIYIATSCTVIYFVFLLFKIFKVWTVIRQKRAAHLYRTCENRRLKVEGIIYRLKFLMIFTLFCAGTTIVSYSMKQHGEAQMHSEDSEGGILTHSTSAFFTGTFGMWNIYVFLLLAMYAPSHKHYAGAIELVDENEDLLVDGSTESNAMTTFLKSSTE